MSAALIDTDEMHAPRSPRFEPLRVLGEGGSGVVYEVRIRAGATFVEHETLALKVLRAELAPSERERRRFLAEAERMQRLHAPGLVALLESGLLPDGRPYLAMPLLDGETLAERLKRGPLPAPVAARYFAILASAVDALHAAGMVHRDVKPENIILVEDSPVLLDFGIARDIDDGTTTTTAEGRVRGTPAYMAPERFFGAPASVRSDVYELGVVLYMMLVGRLPWGSEKSVTDRLNPANPRDAGADVSRTLATVILRALSTRPEVRPATARELAAEVAATAGEGAAPSRRTVDVEVQPVAGAEGFAMAPVAAEPTVTTPRARRLGPFAVAVTCVVALGVGMGARSLGRRTANAEAPPLTTQAPPLPAAVAAVSPADVASASPFVSAPATAPSPAASAAPPGPRSAPTGRATGRPSAPSTPLTATTRTTAPSIPSGAPAETAARPVASALDPGRWLEDRR